MIRRAAAVLAMIILTAAAVQAADAPAAVTTAAEIDFNGALKYSLESSAVIKQAVADVGAAEAVVEKTYGMFDVNLKGGVTYLETKAESTSSFSPDKTHVLSYTAGLSNKLFTGGFLSLDYSSDRTSLFFPAPDPSFPIDLSSLLTTYNPTFKPTLSLTYTQPLLNGFWGRPDEKAIKIGELSIKNAKENLKMTITGKVKSLKEAYFGVYMADKMKKIKDDFYNDGKGVYDETVNLKKIGLRDESDILQTKASMLSAQADLSSAENMLKTVSEVFLNEAGYPASDWEKLSVKITDEVEEVYIPETLTPDLEATLTELQSESVLAKTMLEMAQTGKEIAENSSLPSLNLIGRYGLEGVDGLLSGAYEKLGSNKYNNFMIGANFSWSIPNRGGFGEVREKEEGLKKAAEQFNYMKNMLKISIRSAYRQLLTAKNDYELKKEARQLLEKGLKLQKNKFTQGRISTRELIMSQREFHGSRMSEAAAFTEYAKAVSAWNRIAGKYDFYYNDYAKAKEK